MKEVFPAAEEQSSCENQWFVMRFLYNDQPKIRQHLANDRIETFSPMRQVVVERGGKRITIQEPIIRDLFFVHSTRAILDPYVMMYPHFQYRYRVGGKYREPMVVPEAQMNSFIQAVGISSKPIYFAPHELDITKGTRIRIIGGAMDGYEGILLKVKGARTKRLIVEIPDTLAVAVEVQPDLIQILK